MKKQKGVTLLETILVLSLMGIIMTGGLKLYKNASESVKTNSAMREIAMTSTRIRDLYTSSKNYNDLTNDVAKNAGIELEDIRISITPSTTFDLTYEATSTISCTKLALTDLGQKWIKINDVEITDVAGAAEACSENQILIYTFE